MLIEYVNSGGNVYIAGGTGAGGSAANEAALWNPFLEAFGLAFDGERVQQRRWSESSTSSHPIFTGVSELYELEGSSVLVTGASTDAAVLQSFNGNGLWTV